MPDRSGDDQILIRNRSASGGVNTFSSPLDIENDEVVDLTNGIAAVPGIRKSRQGTSIVASGITFGPILAMSEFTPSTFVTELLAVTPGATYPNAEHLKVWKWPGSGNWTLVGTLSGFTSPTLPVDIVPGLDLNAGGGPAVVRFNTRQPVVNNYYYGGGGISLCTGSNGMPSTGMFPMGMAVGRMFAGGRSGSDRGKLFFSDVASFCTTGWSPSVQSLTLGGSTKQELVAVKSFRSGDLLCFMQDRLEAILLNGDPIQGLSGAPASGLWSRETVDATIGCGARRTVQTVGQDLIFVDQNANVRSIARTLTDNSQGTKTRPLSAPIQSWIDRVNIAKLRHGRGRVLRPILRHLSSY